MKHPILEEIQPKVNSFTSYPTHRVTNEKYQYIVSFVEKYKLTEEWAKTPKPENYYHEGRRYHDNERVTSVILGSIRLCIQSWFKELALVPEKIDYEEAFEYYVKEINDEKLTEWVNTALLYSAGCDHWYTFEKEY